MSWIFDAYANVYGAALLGAAGHSGLEASKTAQADSCRTASYLASFR